MPVPSLGPCHTRGKEGGGIEEVTDEDHTGGEGEEESFDSAESARKNQQMVNGRGMQKATGNHCIKDLSRYPQDIHPINSYHVGSSNTNGLQSRPDLKWSGAGRLDNLIQEMDRMKIEILGVCEVRWPGSGMVKSGGKVFYYSGDNANRNQHGVGILMNENLQKSMKCFVPISERVALVQILGKPLNINIIQVYAPTADKPEQEVEDFYKQIDTALKLTRTNEINIILGDFNAKVGRGRTGSVVGDWGLGERNNRGEGLVQYCEENNLMIANTWFKLPARRLYTWTPRLHHN
ncbi:craniofacial development protein 2-like [Cylas formicarius]|uniref:craniofacial development protein 2-like n=1 Tax=Cylas formicarius TaxID=197179 RepID=UPI0029585124|nr:craniofacial development protein 2-like [Cylas formicarius]